MFDVHLKQKTLKWIRQYLKNRGKKEDPMSGRTFMTYINAQFEKGQYQDQDGNQLKWSESTALRQMHKLGMEYCAMKQGIQGMCDQHERIDVRLAREKCVKLSSRAINHQ